MRHSSLSELFGYFDKHPRDIAYAGPAGYRTARRSYRWVAETSARLARDLEARGVVPGDRILLWGPNSGEWAAAFWGIIVRGAVVVPIDWASTPDFARRVAQQVNAKVVISGRKQEPLNQAIPTLALEDLPSIVAQHSAGSPGARYASPSLDRSAIAEIVFTSGTTAEPKGVVLTHGNILANFEPIEGEIQKYLKYEWPFHPIRFLNLLPLSHVFGQFLGLFLPAVLGGTVMFQDSLNPADVARIIRRERISVLVAVPRMLESMRNKIERDFAARGRAEWFSKQLDIASRESGLRRWWRFRKIHSEFGFKFWALICGGATLPTETESFWNKMAFAVVQGYGMTETASLISLNHPFRPGAGSIGKVLQGSNVKLDETGEILVRGESVATGYWRDAGMDVAPSGDEQWFHTGDIGGKDSEGNLYFKGRRKNVIVTAAGMNVYPEDLEAALRRQPEIRDCIVLAVERDGNADACAAILLRTSQTDAAGAVDRANQSLAEYQRIRRWLVWPEADFPRTSTGKPRTDVIAARIASDEDHSSAGTQGLADLIARFGVSPREGTAGELSPAARLEADLGLSSLDRVELISALEDRYQVTLNEAAFSGETTVADLAKLLQETTPRVAQEYNAYPLWPQRWPVTWIRAFVYTLLAWPATHILAHPSVRGREKLRKFKDYKGPVVVVSNHMKYDIGFVLAALPLRYRYSLAVAMDGERLRAMRHPPAIRRFWGGWLDRLTAFLMTLIFNVFGLPRVSGYRDAFHFAGESVDRGYSILIYPEGWGTTDGLIHPFKTGVGLLALNLNIPVLPMRIEGMWAIAERNRFWAKPGQVRVTIGEPVRFPPGTPPEEIAKQLQQIISALGDTPDRS
jgi:long-chain acyl-CoA synthetase